VAPFDAEQARQHQEAWAKYLGVPVEWTNSIGMSFRLIPPGEFHQLTNTGDSDLHMIYCYGPAGDVAHWRQELDGSLPRAGVDVPALPEGAWPQCTEKPRA